MSRGVGRLLGIASIAWLASGLAACDFFSTRDAEEGTGEGSVWIPPTTPEIVVENLEAAFEAGVFGDYIRAFTDEFFFRPDETDSTQLAIERPGEPVYVNWTREVETQVAESIASGAQSVDLTMIFLEEQIVPDGRLHKYSYTLTLTRGAGGVDVYEGQAWFTIQQLGSEWLILKWEDVITEQTEESWGRLKGRSRQL